ncbi:uncharacterized protein TNCT_219931 [Trichonephila clavata]|uniref:Uncharacterized protein n=1 Tax=Trichonephila clavata TaxID=2740835 RepID=A0A8X6K2C8_TRICU|nr:uncharacterized protein TNCT_219931 [Trichonephila clavata]
MAPRVCCNICSVRLLEWLVGKKRAMQFAVPMVWCEPTNHVDNFYFCLAPSMNMGWSRKKKDHLQYPCVPSAIQLVPHSAEISILGPPKKFEIVKDYVEEEEFIRPGTSHEQDFKAKDLNEPHE